MSPEVQDHLQARLPSITDPTTQSEAHRWDNPSALNRLLLSLIDDPRDVPFARLIFFSTLTTVPWALALYVPGVFSWWLAFAYLAFNGAMHAPRIVLMLHNLVHGRIFKKEYDLLNKWVVWGLGPFFGETPEAYYVHHVGMHHAENNLPRDLSTTLRYRRDSFAGWLHYYANFLFTGDVRLPRYCYRKGRPQLAHRFMRGEYTYYVVALAALFVNWRAAVVTFWGPLVFVRFLMMAGNWGQHAFVDPNRPNNSHLNSITCINTGYNQQCFNDGYHASHHLKPGLHWLELPNHFQQNIRRFAEEDAFVVEGMDFFMVWLLLMLGQHKVIARHYVDIRHMVLGEPRRTEADILALMETRLKPFKVSGDTVFLPDGTAMDRP
jgi:fatty acid desaturase